MRKGKKKCIICLSKDNREMVELPTIKNQWYHPGCFEEMYGEGDTDGQHADIQHSDPIHIRV